MSWRSVSLCVGHDHKPRKTAEPIEIPSDGTLAPPVEYDESIYIDCIAFNSVLDWTEPIYAAVAVRAVAVVTAATRSMFSSVYTGWSDVTESMVRIRSPFCGYNTTQCGQLKGEDLSCYSNETKSASLRNVHYDHWLTNKAYLSAITVTNIFESFTCKMAAKINWHRYEPLLRHCHPTCASCCRLAGTSKRAAAVFATHASRAGFPVDIDAWWAYSAATAGAPAASPVLTHSTVGRPNPAPPTHSRRFRDRKWKEYWDRKCRSASRLRIFVFARQLRSSIHSSHLPRVSATWRCNS